MSNVQLTDVTRLAEVESANLYMYELEGSPVYVLEVVAQQSGFNWDLRIRSGFVHGLDYYPYLVVETKMSPDWPPIAGHGPVVPLSTLHKTISHVGLKGVEVIGSNGVKRVDFPTGA